MRAHKTRPPRRRRADFDPTATPDAKIIRLLRTGGWRESLSAYFGAREYRKLAALARLAGTRSNGCGTLLYLLPGLMGSTLNVGHRAAGKTSPQGRDADEFLWFNPQAIEAGKLLLLSLQSGRSTANRSRRTTRKRLYASGVLLPTYLKLRLRLEIAGYRVRFHPYDWRLGSAALGKELLRRIEADLAANRMSAHAEPSVLIVAHSMGGLVARAALARDEKGRISKLVQLATPNGGSFATLQALRGVYPTVQKLLALTGPDLSQRLLQAFRSLPSLHEQLPRLNLSWALFRRENWPLDSGRPLQRQLDDARTGLDGLAAADERCFVIVGVNRETIVGARLITRQRAVGATAECGFEYSYSLAGDGTVPVELAVWPGAPTWYVEENHGALPGNDKVCGAILDLLAQGNTRKLQSRWQGRKKVLHRASDEQLRTRLTGRLYWAELSPEEQRRFLEPVLSQSLERVVRPARPRRTAVKTARLKKRLQ